MHMCLPRTYRRTPSTILSTVWPKQWRRSCKNVQTRRISLAGIEAGRHGLGRCVALMCGAGGPHRYCKYTTTTQLTNGHKTWSTTLHETKEVMLIQADRQRFVSPKVVRAAAPCSTAWRRSLLHAHGVHAGWNVSGCRPREWFDIRSKFRQHQLAAGRHHGGSCVWRAEHRVPVIRSTARLLRDRGTVPVLVCSGTMCSSICTRSSLWRPTSACRYSLVLDACLSAGRRCFVEVETSRTDARIVETVI